MINPGQASPRLAVIFMALAACMAQGQDLVPAFPGAEGFGKWATGGTRLPPEITRPVPIKTLFVTNLNDSGEGSLRAAVEASGPRVVIFRVSGIIQLSEPLVVRNGNLTVAGQTAPGDGICIAGYPMGIDANNVVVRFLRMRLGDANDIEADAFGITPGRSNIIIDHCSTSWAIDETFSLYAVRDVTVQWCMITESLYKSIHEKGTHGYGSIWGGNGASFHHNLFAHHTSRTPRFNGGRASLPELTDFRNNVIYNWGFNSAYGGEVQAQINVVNNYYKYGPATRESVRARIVEPTSDRDMSGQVFLDENGDPYHTGKWHVSGNHVYGFPAITADNWAGGVQGAFADDPGIRANEPFPVVDIPTQSAEEAYRDVLRLGGARLPRRDPVDRRIMEEVRTGTATHGGIYGAGTGIIDTPSDVGGYPAYNSIEPLPDTDSDGIPNVWESANGLNPDDAGDAHTVTQTGYTHLEQYLNALAAPAMPDPYGMQPVIAATPSGESVILSWDPRFAGYRLEYSEDPGTAGWEPVAGSTAATEVRVPRQTLEGFYRLTPR